MLWMTAVRSRSRLGHSCLNTALQIDDQAADKEIFQMMGLVLLITAEDNGSLMLDGSRVNGFLEDCVQHSLVRKSCCPIILSVERSQLDDCTGGSGERLMVVGQSNKVGELVSDSVIHVNFGKT